jgi:tol-pal system protein YbgF
MGMKSTFLAACLLSASVSPSLAFKPQADIPGARPVILTQDAGGNIQMEEQIRLLNGKVEELTFQILQMQEQMRKLQEDNEFRFQELEKTRQGKAQPKEENTEAAAQAESPADEPKKEGSIRVVTTEKTNSTDDIAATIDGAEGVGAPPKDLGSVKFDENGNPIGGSVADPGQVAALPKGDNPAEIYKTAYEHILAGEYPSAEAGFRQHVENYPGDPQAADANYWLGESLIGQERYRDAAEVLLKAQKQYPKSKKAPDMLLKLGVSLAALDNKDVACATFAQVGKKYPKAAPALVERVSAEQAKAGC